MAKIITVKTTIEIDGRSYGANPQRPLQVEAVDEVEYELKAAPDGQTSVSKTIRVSPAEESADSNTEEWFRFLAITASDYEAGVTVGIGSASGAKAIKLTAPVLLFNESQFLALGITDKTPLDIAFTNPSKTKVKVLALVGRRAS